jgi:hypothetical protein
MIHIDRVRTEMEVLSGSTGDARTAASDDASALLGSAADPAARRRLSELVLDVLREHVRELERRGTL